MARKPRGKKPAGKKTLKAIRKRMYWPEQGEPKRVISIHDGLARQRIVDMLKISDNLVVEHMNYLSFLNGHKYIFVKIKGINQPRFYFLDPEKTEYRQFLEEATNWESTEL